MRRTRKSALFILTLAISSLCLGDVSFGQMIIEEPSVSYFKDELKKDHIYEIASKEYNQKMIEHEEGSYQDLETWFKEYRQITNKYSWIIDVPETLYDYFSEEELDRMFRVVQAEIGDEYSFEQKCNVASVILNRIEHEKFKDDMFSVLSKDQFATISNGRYKRVEVSETTRLACEYAFEISDTTDGCLFFDSNGMLNYQFVFNDGAHNFYKIKGEK